MTSTTLQRHLAFERTVDASPEEVFRAWTDPARLTWFLNPEQPMPDEPIEVDLRVGATWRLMMVVNENLRYFTGGLYREIDEPSKLVFAWGAYGGWPELDADNPEATPIVTLTFDSQDGKTHMTLDVLLPDSMSEQNVAKWLDSGMREGWPATIDRVVEMFANIGG